MQVLSSILDFREARRSMVGTVGLVPTMGYLHPGHLALVRRARSENEVLAISIFVNPSQFGSDEDFDTYPRDMERDLALLAAEGADLVFTPSREEMYPPGFDSWVEVGEVGRHLEGEHRPGHFRGVATIVALLFDLVNPDRAYFGQKDGQQVALIRRMVAEGDLGVEIVVVPTVREPDGLALSSRNTYLTPDQRNAAPVIYRALRAAQELWERGERWAEPLRREVRRLLEEEQLIQEIDYVSVADTSTMEELEHPQGQAMVSVAVRMGRVRLIDNVLLG